MPLLRKKKNTAYTLWITLLVAGLGFAIKALILHPIYIQLATNVSHMNKIYTTILYYLIDGGLLDMAVIAVCYPAAAYAVWQKGLKGSKRVILAFTLLTAGKFVANYVMDILTYSGLPRMTEFLTDLPLVLLMLVLELIPYALTVATVALAKSRYDRKAELAAYRSELTDTAAPARTPLQEAAFPAQSPPAGRLCGGSGHLPVPRDQLPRLPDHPIEQFRLHRRLGGYAGYPPGRCRAGYPALLRRDPAPASLP